jgi:hypothetical protein
MNEYLKMFLNGFLFMCGVMIGWLILNIISEGLSHLSEIV